jgi:hypothetical protein
MSSVTLVLLGALVFSADDEDKVSLKELDIELPKTIGKFEYKNRRDYEGRGLGYSVAYSSKMCTATLFVYDGNKKDIPDGKTSKIVMEEMKTIAGDLQEAQKRNVIKKLETMKKGALPLPKSALEKFAATGYTFELKGGDCKSYALLTGYKKHFFKIRITQFVVDGKTNDAEMKEFLEEIAKLIKKPEK